MTGTRPRDFDWAVPEHYNFGATRDEGTKKLLLLQNCAFVPMFRAMVRGKIADVRKYV